MPREIQKITFFDAQTEAEKECILTCPGFDTEGEIIGAKQRAMVNYYESKKCNRGHDCNVIATFNPNLYQLQVEGRCPKV